MTHTTAELQLIEQRVTNEGPSVGVAYLLWFFFGVLSGHRWYLRRPVSAMLQIASILCLVGIVWWALDGFLIPGMARSNRDKIRRKVAGEIVDRASI